MCYFLLAQLLKILQANRDEISIIGKRKSKLTQEPTQNTENSALVDCDVSKSMTEKEQNLKIPPSAVSLLFCLQQIIHLI